MRRRLLAALVLCCVAVALAPLSAQQSRRRIRPQPERPAAPVAVVPLVAGEPAGTPAGLKHVAFASTSGAFPNPDRGFYTWADQTPEGYAAVRAAGFTLVRQYFMLDAYRDQPLPASYLNSLTQEFALARHAGVKHIVRFAYNFGPYPNPAPDASQARITQHLQQLAPVLAANEDVISSLEAGFIGAWGEWHSSTNGLDTSVSAKAAILAALMAAVPSSRMIALRYPSDMQLLNGAPITPAEAFSGINRARVGSHQDCFLASDDDWGTWGRGGNPYDVDKAYVAENGRWAVVGGETCNVNPPRSLCPTALAELEYMHFSNLDVDYEPAVIQGFRAGGCYDEMDRRLGYRLEFGTAGYSPTVAAGAGLPLVVQVRNVGYAAMFNARPVFAVLTGPGGRYVTPLAVDPRTWAAGGAYQLSTTIPLPTDMTPGTYQLSLWLPDQAPSLRNDPRFAVRVAAGGVWDAATGENVIARDITVSLPNGSAPVPPDHFRVTALNGNALTLAWAPSPNGATPTGFLLEGGTAAGETVATLPLGLGGPVTLRVPDGVFYVRLRTIAGALTSAPSNEIVVHVNTSAPPRPPGGLLGLVVGDGVALSWQNPQPGGNAPTAILLDVTGSATGTVTLGAVDHFAVAGVPAGTYTIAARAANAVGTSAATPPVTLTVPSGCSGPPQPPAWFSATNSGALVTVAWGLPAAGPAPTGYLLQVSGATVATLPATLRELTAPVPPGGYVVSVVATNPCGASAPTPATSLTIS